MVLQVGLQYSPVLPTQEANTSLRTLTELRVRKQWGGLGANRAVPWFKKGACMLLLVGMQHGSSGVSVAAVRVHDLNAVPYPMPNYQYSRIG